MKVIDLTKTHPSIDEILRMARFDIVMIHGTDGVQYILEEADEFEREVAALGLNEEFMTFLQKRSEEPGEKPGPKKQMVQKLKKSVNKPVLQKIPAPLLRVETGIEP